MNADYDSVVLRLIVNSESERLGLQSALERIERLGTMTSPAREPYYKIAGTEKVVVFIECASVESTYDAIMDIIAEPTDWQHHGDEADPYAFWVEDKAVGRKIESLRWASIEPEQTKIWKL